MIGGQQFRKRNKFDLVLKFALCLLNSFHFNFYPLNSRNIFFSMSCLYTSTVHTKKIDYKCSTVYIYFYCLAQQGEIISKGSVTIIIISMKFPQTISAKIIVGILLTRLNCCHGENSKEKTIQEKCVTFFVDRAVVPLAIQKPQINFAPTQKLLSSGYFFLSYLKGFVKQECSLRNDCIPFGCGKNWTLE